MAFDCGVDAVAAPPVGPARSRVMLADDVDTFPTVSRSVIKTVFTPAVAVAVTVRVNGEPLYGSNVVVHPVEVVATHRPAVAVSSVALIATVSAAELVNAAPLLIRIVATGPVNSARGTPSPMKPTPTLPARSTGQIR